MKYVGIWWGMHINTMTWSSGPKHGATTANTQALHRLRRGQRARRRAGRGMEHRLGRRLDREPERLLVHPGVSRLRSAGRRRVRASRRACRLIVHNETSGGIENYERQLDSAFALYHSLGLDAIKSGYVTDTDGGGHSHHSPVHGAALPQGDRDGGQVRHHGGRARADARHRRAPHLSEHDEPRRRARAGVQRLERRRRQPARARDDPLLHAPAGRADGLHAGHLRHPARAQHRARRAARTSRASRTTLAKQLALYVVLYSPLQMAADLPENYVEPAGVPVHPRRRRGLGHDASDRRQDRRLRDRRAQAAKGSHDWFLGAITDEEARTFDVPLVVPDAGPAATWPRSTPTAPGPTGCDNPLPVTISTAPVTSATRLRVVLAPGGGQAIRIRPAR